LVKFPVISVGYKWILAAEAFEHRSCQVLLAFADTIPAADGQVLVYLRWDTGQNISDRFGLQARNCQEVSTYHIS